MILSCLTVLTGYPFFYGEFYDYSTYCHGNSHHDPDNDKLSAKAKYKITENVCEYARRTNRLAGKSGLHQRCNIEAEDESLRFYFFINKLD